MVIYRTAQHPPTLQFSTTSLQPISIIQVRLSNGLPNIPQRSSSQPLPLSTSQLLLNNFNNFYSFLLGIGINQRFPLFLHSLCVQCVNLCAHLKLQHLQLNCLHLWQEGNSLTGSLHTSLVSIEIVVFALGAFQFRAWLIGSNVFSHPTLVQCHSSMRPELVESHRPDTTLLQGPMQ